MANGIDGSAGLLWASGGTRHYDKLYLARWAASNLLGDWDQIEEGDEEKADQSTQSQTVSGRTAADDGGRPAAEGAQNQSEAASGRTTAAPPDFESGTPRRTQSGAYFGASSPFRRICGTHANA